MVSPMARPVLVGYDPRGDDRAPVDFGAAAARFTGAPLVVAAVQSGGAPGTDADLVDDCAAAITRVEADLTAQGLTVTCRVLRGTSAAQALHEASEQEDTGLLVVGSTHRSRMGRVLPGSTAERLLHGAPCPVAVVPRAWSGRPDGPQTIAVGFDDTPEGHEALRAAHALAARAGATLRVIRAVRDHLDMYAELEPKLPSRTDRTDLEDAEGEHKLVVERLVRQRLAGLGGNVAVEIDVVVDDAADTLVAVSEHVDLLVCGSRGYGPLRAVLLGSVARRVVDAAHCPVIVLPRGVSGVMDELVGAASVPQPAG
jgi:nucleotide-binding universal stress UspA family protein